MSIEAMKQALEVLEQINQLSIGENAIALPGEIDGAMDNLRSAIDHYDQTLLELCEVCGWRALIPGDGCLVCARQKAARQWVGLTDQQVLDLADEHLYGGDNYRILDFYKAIQQKLKEKNDVLRSM
jgi:hypothetical protein